MKYFILKKPAFIDFSMEKYSEKMPLMSKHQILSDGKMSNASLVKHKNGKWYIRYGDALLELKSIESKEMAISSIKMDSGSILGKDKNKWFLQNTENL